MRLKPTFAVDLSNCMVSRCFKTQQAKLHGSIDAPFFGTFLLSSSPVDFRAVLDLRKMVHPDVAGDEAQDMGFSVRIQSLHQLSNYRTANYRDSPPVIKLGKYLI